MTATFTEVFTEVFTQTMTPTLINLSGAPGFVEGVLNSRMGELSGGEITVGQVLVVFFIIGMAMMIFKKVK
jgi:hypothetical protein